MTPRFLTLETKWMDGRATCERQPGRDCGGSSGELQMNDVVFLLQLLSVWNIIPGNSEYNSPDTLKKLSLRSKKKKNK